MVDYKKLCAALLSMALCFSAAAPVSSAFAEESGAVQDNAEAQVVESGNLSYYPLGDGKAVLVSIKSEGDTLDIPDKADDVAITEIDANALDGVGASVINIPAGIEYISAENPFTRCENLTAVNVDGGNAEYCSVDGVLYNKDKTALLCCPAGVKGDSFTIPDSVTSVGVAALYDTQFRSISVPAGVTEIKRHAFSYCAELASIDLSGTAVEYIGDMAFASCEKLSDVKLPDTLTELGSGAFALCGKLTDITLPEKLQAVGQSAFQGTGLSRIVVPASVEGIGYCAFGYDKDENPIEDFVIVGENGSAAQKYATDKDEEYGIENNFQFVSSEAQAAIDEYEALDTKMEGDFEYAEIDGSAALIFCYSSDNEIVVPAELGGLKLTAIRDTAFYGCPAQKIVIPDGVETIGAMVFPASVAELTLPGSLKEIKDKEPFIACTSLTSVTVTEGDGGFSSQDGVLYNKDKSKLVAYPIAKADESFKAPSSLKEVGYSAFCNNLHLKKADLTGVESIATYAFDGCAALENVIFSKTLKTVGNDAFYGCPNLKSVRLYDSIEVIGDYAFGYIYDASSLEENETQDALEAYLGAEQEEKKDGSVLLDGFRIYAPKGSLGYKYAQACGIETVTDTVRIGEKNVSIPFLCTVGGILLAVLLAAAGVLTGKKIKARKEEKKKAEARAKAAEKLRRKKEEQKEEETE